MTNETDVDALTGTADDQRPDIGLIADAMERRQRRVIFPRLVSHDRAAKAVERLVNSHFNNRPGEHARFSIPVEADDDDVALMDYIAQQEAGWLRAFDAGTDAMLETMIGWAQGRRDAGTLRRYDALQPAAVTREPFEEAP